MTAFGRYSVSTVSNTQRNGWESAMMKTEASNIHPSKDSIGHEISYSKNNTAAAGKVHKS